jgi:hypothetical protein
MLYQLSCIPNTEKFNKLCKVCQVILSLVKGAGVPSASIRYLTAMSKVQMWPWLQWHGTLTHHSQLAQPSWPICLFSTLYLEALLRPKYLSLTAFHFYIFGYNFLRYTLLKPGNSLSLHHSSSALGHHVTPLQMLSLPTSTQSLCHLTKDVSGVQNMTNFAHDHINDGLFVQRYTKTEIICSMRDHIDQ